MRAIVWTGIISRSQYDDGIAGLFSAAELGSSGRIRWSLCHSSVSPFARRSEAGHLFDPSLGARNESCRSFFFFLFTTFLSNPVLRTNDIFSRQSAVMSGMKVIAVKTHAAGNLDMEDLREKAIKYKDTLAAFMVTYPSTYGVFESGVEEACSIIHENGGQVYLDGELTILFLFFFSFRRD